MKGGHFAGAIFNQNECIKHKSFHRYTVRKKQGGSQSSKDNQNLSNKPKSSKKVYYSFLIKRL